jgi:hypothetical protein
VPSPTLHLIASTERNAPPIAITAKNAIELKMAKHANGITNGRNIRRLIAHVLLAIARPDAIKLAEAAEQYNTYRAMLELGRF